MPLDYVNLSIGDVVSCREFVLDLGMVAKYVAAVGDKSDVFEPTSLAPIAPPMAVGALSLRGVLDDLGIPPGTLHAGQEMEFLDSVSVGETLTCLATIAQNSVRRGVRLVGVKIDVVRGDRTIAMRAKSMIMVPA